MVSVSERVELPCNTSGTPPPTVTWTRDRRRINYRDDRFTQRDDGTLVIQNIEDRDQGVYVCTAENAVGKDSQSRLLRVQGKTLLIFAGFSDLEPNGTNL